MSSLSGPTTIWRAFPASLTAGERGHTLVEWVAAPNAEAFYLHHGTIRITEVRASVLATPILSRTQLSLPLDFS